MDFYLFIKAWVKSLAIFLENLLDSAKISTTDAIKAASKQAIQKTAEAPGDLIDNKSVSKQAAKELQNNEKELDVER